jgi:dCMP deaminase
MRISREAMYMNMARVASMRSTCSRLNVGSIITKDNSPISIGWNGAASGEPHCSGNSCPGMVPGNCPTIHAEANALNKAAALLEWGDEVDLYVTDSPCPTCADLIVHSPLFVRRLFFETPYRNANLTIFGQPYKWGRGMQVYDRTTEVYEVTPAGYIVEYFTRQVTQLP